ncbi:hypothetical protein [Desulfosporosinus sp. BICA1-9]|nr:hypothetical protein [Desulfosporosinus sp. BICA1-9]
MNGLVKEIKHMKSLRQRTVRNWRHGGSGRSTKNGVSHDEINISKQ